jgi:two-component system, cell cycle sensor histidine kinase and response regulator CckA
MAPPTTDAPDRPTGLLAILTRPLVATSIPLIVGTALSLSAFQTARRTEDLRIRAEFLKEVEHNMGGIRFRLNQSLESLQSIRNVYLAADMVHPAEFNQVAEETLKRHPALQAVAWIPRIDASALPGHRKWARQHVSEDFAFAERNETGSLVPLTPRPAHFPILFQMPVIHSDIGLGEDIGVSDSRLEKLDLCRDTGRVVMTEQLASAVNPETGNSVLAFAPVYRHEPLPDTLADRRRLITGYIGAVLNVGSLIDNAMAESRWGSVDVVAYDVSNSRRRLLHSTLPASAEVTFKATGYVDSIRHNGQTENLAAAARAWQLRFTPSEEWISSVNSITPQVVLLVGLAFTALLSRFLRTIARRNAKIERLVARRTKDLVLTNELLREEIASRKQSEALLIDSDERFRVTFEEAPVGIGHASLLGKYLRVNDRLCEITGYSREELLAHHWQDITHPDDLASDELTVAALLNGKRSTYSMDKRYRRKDGGEVWVNLTVALVRTKNGEPSYFISITNDLTESRAAQEQLKQERNLLRTLIDGIPDSIYIKDRSGRFIAQNRADREFLGVEDPEEAVGKTVYDFDALKNHADLYFKDDMRVIETGFTVVNREEPFTKPDGSEGWFMTTKLPLRDEHGEITGLIGITRDITTRKQDESEKIDILQKLQTTQKLESMGLLAGGIAHDFNNLLTGIHGHAGLMRLSSDQYPAMLPHITEIEQIAQRASELCRQMLDYSGHNRHESQRLDLNATIRQSLPLLRHSVDKKSELKFEPAESLPAFQGDPTQFRQILMNLVINASDALSESHGVIRVITGVMRADRHYLDTTIYDDNLTEGDYVFLEVTDNGEGMPAGVMAKIFDPFFTTKKTGRGLGLATVIGIVRSHGGAIKIHSQENQGTIFRVLLPACDKPAEQFPEDEQTGWNWHSRGKVLVIDDEETVRTVSARILEALGFDPVMAANGRDGAELFRNAAADYKLVLTDYAMPVMDGAETYARIKKMRHDVPIVLMSGYWEEKATAKFGPDLAGFLKKPFSPEQLRDQIREAIVKSQKIVGDN